MALNNQRSRADTGQRLQNRKSGEGDRHPQAGPIQDCRKIRSLVERQQLPKQCLTLAGMLLRHELPLEVLAGYDLMGWSGRLQH